MAKSRASKEPPAETKEGGVPAKKTGFKGTQWKTPKGSNNGGGQKPGTLLIGTRGQCHGALQMVATMIMEARKAASNPKARAKERREAIAEYGRTLACANALNGIIRTRIISAKHQEEIDKWARDDASGQRIKDLENRIAHYEQMMMDAGLLQEVTQPETLPGPGGNA